MLNSRPKYAADSNESHAGSFDFDKPKLGEALALALVGIDILDINQHPVHFMQRRERTVLLVQDKKKLQHKYIIAKNVAGHEYFIALPLCLVASHREILSKLQRTAGEELHCIGGGWITLGRVMVIHGVSSEFGPGDHYKAGTAFRQVVGAEIELITK